MHLKPHRIFQVKPSVQTIRKELSRKANEQQVLVLAHCITRFVSEITCASTSCPPKVINHCYNIPGIVNSKYWQAQTNSSNRIK